MFKFDSLTKLIGKPLDRRIVTQLSKGGRTFDFIEGFAIYPLLREAFGDNYSIRLSEPITKKYATIDTKKGPYTPPEVTEVKCTLIVHKPDGQDIVREAFGAATMNANGEENVAKSAQTDAIKKAAMSFGIGLELSAQKEQRFVDWYQENVFGVWTQAAVQRLGNVLAAARKFMEKYGLGKNLDGLGYYAFGKATRVTPGNIEEVVGQLTAKEQAKNQEKVA